ncbi:DUF3667 domain-containing protein [Novosphingobium panipatense]
MLTASALEKEQRLVQDGHTHESACLNCGTALVGTHCHACGQAAHVHRTLGAFFHDLLHGVFHFEGKTWRTLPLLAWKPGELTRQYVEGRRASFVSPIALFLFSVFLMFAVFHSTQGGRGRLMCAVTTGRFPGRSMSWKGTCAATGPPQAGREQGPDDAGAG